MGQTIQYVQAQGLQPFSSEQVQASITQGGGTVSLTQVSWQCANGNPQFNGISIQWGQENAGNPQAVNYPQLLNGNAQGFSGLNALLNDPIVLAALILGALLSQAASQGKTDGNPFSRSDNTGSRRSPGYSSSTPSTAKEVLDEISRMIKESNEREEKLRRKDNEDTTTSGSSDAIRDSQRREAESKRKLEEAERKLEAAERRAEAAERKAEEARQKSSQAAPQGGTTSSAGGTTGGSGGTSDTEQARQRAAEAERVKAEAEAAEAEAKRKEAETERARKEVEAREAEEARRAEEAKRAEAVRKAEEARRNEKFASTAEAKPYVDSVLNTMINATRASDEGLSQEQVQLASSALTKNWGQLTSDELDALRAVGINGEAEFNGITGKKLKAWQSVLQNLNQNYEQARYTYNNYWGDSTIEYDDLERIRDGSSKEYARGWVAWEYHESGAIVRDAIMGQIAAQHLQ